MLHAIETNRDSASLDEIVKIDPSGPVISNGTRDIEFARFGFGQQGGEARALWVSQSATSAVVFRKEDIVSAFIARVPYGPYCLV
jgi:hypothetical protein